MIKFKIFGFGDNTERAKAPAIEPAQIVPDPSAVTEANPTGKRVLIVDDDFVFLKVTAAKLKSAGFRVSTASESAEAITALGEQPADAILLDVNFQPDVCNGGMGSWDGFQLMSWLRGSPAAKGARFIMISSSDAAADRERAKKLGAVAYLHKPVNQEQLLALVNGEN
jgi:CheY-like chemotaxis protein